MKGIVLFDLQYNEIYLEHQSIPQKMNKWFVQQHKHQIIVPPEGRVGVEMKNHHSFFFFLKEMIFLSKKRTHGILGLIYFEVGNFNDWFLMNYKDLGSYQDSI